MADISDVEQAMANEVTAVLYPQGAAQSSIVGVTCRIYRGWPNTATLTSDLSAGIVNVTVISDNDTGKTSTRYLTEWHYSTVAPTLSVVVQDKAISIIGFVTAGSVVGVLVDNLAFTYRVELGDTPDLIASNLCNIMQSTSIATVQGSIVSLPGATSIVARVVCDTSTMYEGRRQEKSVRVILWCPSPTIRDFVAGAVDLTLAQVAFLLMPDGSSARITYRNSSVFDQSQNALLYRRDLVYDTEYATIISTELPSMLFGAAAMNGQVRYG